MTLPGGQGMSLGAEDVIGLVMEVQTKADMVEAVIGFCAENAAIRRIVMEALAKQDDKEGAAEARAKLEDSDEAN